MPVGFVSLQELRERAQEFGLDVGSSSAPPGPEKERLVQWLDAGNHAEMRWLERDPARRADPRIVLEGARSVVSVGLNYFQGDLPDPADRPTGLIARYALGDDYHDLLLTKVRSLAESLGDDLARPYVDTGPVLEKPRAQRAGLGWVGKHTNCVSRSHGSWWFLGDIITRTEVEPSEPHVDRCGTCTRCLDVCPTKAIRADQPYRLDSRLCISYLTIEHRGPIPRELRPLIGTWIYGCDLCLDVCPWNRFAEPTREERFRPRPELVHPPLEDLLGWDQATFSRVMKGSPIKRTKRRGLLRNVCVALGNAGDRGVVSALATCLATEHEPLVRGHAAWALGVLGGAEARRSLDSARNDEDAYVRSEVEAALDQLPGPGVEAAPQPA
ncbi:MAG: tRNA epoxyqueuosine(34) reductase QueG [Deltaproteobacteria bacterium]|nr:tRNA epoxyqueuosine(34) reductase QueG [Deltaproteobacteria bacterium]